MFWDIDDDDLEKLYDYWVEHLYFDRVLISVLIVVGLMLAKPRGLEIVFAPFLFPFYLWGILPPPCF